MPTKTERTWADLERWLASELMILGTPPGWSEAAEEPELWLSRIAAAEPQEREPIDAALRAIAGGTALPALSTNQRCLLSLRMRWSLGLAGALANAEERYVPGSFPKPLRATPGPESKLYLLIVAWHQLGCMQWVHQLDWFLQTWAEIGRARDPEA
jgi:hypothetical protein